MTSLTVGGRGRSSKLSMEGGEREPLRIILHAQRKRIALFIGDVFQTILGQGK